MNIKDKLKLIQRVSGKTQAMLAAELGVSFPTFNSWINGKSIPRAQAAKRIDELYLQLTGQNIIPANLLEAKKQVLINKRKQYPDILRLLEARKDLYDQFLLALTYNTNRIEGSTLTEPETAAILFQNAALPDKSIIEQMEVKNHQAAFRYLIRHLTNGGAITEVMILKLHGILMNGIREDAGNYRRHAVRIAGSNVVMANYLKVPVLMADLMKDVHRGEKDLIGFSARIHSRFEQIHPFSDGNGRIGRLILVAMLLQEDFAPAIISQEKRRFYILYLNQSQLKGDYSRLEDFICDGMMAGYDLLAV
jgi:Fic family protein/DNA-binding XRE family transcriptional regulator